MRRHRRNPIKGRDRRALTYSLARRFRIHPTCIVIANAVERLGAALSILKSPTSRANDDLFEVRATSRLFLEILCLFSRVSTYK